MLLILQAEQLLVLESQTQGWATAADNPGARILFKKAADKSAIHTVKAYLDLEGIPVPVSLAVLCDLDKSNRLKWDPVFDVIREIERVPGRNGAPEQVTTAQPSCMSDSMLAPCDSVLVLVD